MADEFDADAAIAAAETAAGAGDFALAEQHLREAAALQAAALGPAHPDLANTLNNLGVACEQAGKLDEAEAAYRRAHDIAVAALPPDHPLLVRSTENLRDFCAARGRAFDGPAPVVLEAVPESVQVVASETPADLPAALAPEPAATRILASPPVDAPVSRSAPASEDGRHPFRWIVPVFVVVAIAAVVAWMVSDRGAAPAPAPTPATASTPEPPAPAPALPAPAPSTSADSRPPAAPVPDTAVPRIAAAPVPQVPGSSVVVRAEVCRNFGASGAEWSCDPVGATTTPGALVFYTRLRFPQPTTIVHRWFRGEALMQSVELRVGANPREGYRTFSRQTVRAGASGPWRVQLLDTAGAVLHEHRFTVQ